MKILKNSSLKSFNTFKVEAKASFLVEIQTEDDLKALTKKISLNQMPFLILGKGSNLLFKSNFKGIILKINLRGKKILEKKNSEVLVEVKAGENWNEFVNWTLENGFGGLENLSLIPGTLGAAPVQNIGAYGVEIKDSLKWVKVYEINSGKKLKFENKDCEFGYRDSIFKKDRNKYIILSICFSLKTKNYKLMTSYKDINEKLKFYNLKPTIQNISNLIIEIRKNKLPDPNLIGNAGSFFKNPIVEKSFYEKLKLEFEDLPAFFLEKNQVKVPAAWFIEKSGWRGKKIKNVGVYPKQALVLINLGGASGKEIYDFSKLIEKDVQKKFNIKLENEVTII